mgnify:CR=1 FL=1
MNTKIHQKEEIIKELEDLQPNWKGSAIRTIIALIILFFIFWLYPETLSSPMLWVVLLFSSIVIAEQNSERKWVNKKINALFSIVKGDA